MKTSCSTKVFQNLGAKNIFQAIDIAVELGLDGINIDARENALLAIDNFSFLKSAEIARHALKREMEIQALSINEISADKSEVDRLNKAVSIAHSLACPLVTFSITGIDEETGLVKQYDDLTNVLKQASKLAADFDICFAAEAAYDSITDSFEKALQLFVDVDEYNFGVALNSISLKKELYNNVARDIELIGESLLLVNISEWENCDNAFSILKKNNYKNYICLRNDDLNEKKEIINFVNLIKNYND